MLMVRCPRLSVSIRCALLVPALSFACGTSTDGGGSAQCESGTPVGQAVGRIVDDAGAPVSASLAQFCVRPEGAADVVCIRPQSADETGQYTVSVETEIQCLERATMRAFTSTGAYASMYCDVPLAASDDEGVSVRDIVLHSVVPATAPALGDPAQARWVEMEGGLSLAVTPDALPPFREAEAYRDLGARSVPADDASLCFIDEPEAYVAVFGFFPEVNVAEAGFPLRLANRTGLAPGSAVEVRVLGGLDCEVDGEILEEADWHAVGTATVSADGSVIEGVRLPCLTWVGFRPLP